MFCFQPEVPLCSTAPTSPIAFLTLCADVGNTAHLHVSLPTHFGRVVLSLCSCFSSSGVVGFQKQKVCQDWWSLDHPLPLHLGFRYISKSVSDFFLSYKLLILTLSLLTMFVFIPLISLSGKGASPALQSICSSSYIKIPPVLHKRSAAFHCYLSAVLGFLPNSALSTYSKFFPFSGFSLIKKSFSSILCLSN